MPRRKASRSAKSAGFTVRVYPGEDGQFVAYCDELPGCTSQGRTLDEVHANIKEAMVAYIETLSDLAAQERGRRPERMTGRSVRLIRFTLEAAST